MMWLCPSLPCGVEATSSSKDRHDEERVSSNSELFEGDCNSGVRGDVNCSKAFWRFGGLVWRDVVKDIVTNIPFW